MATRSEAQAAITCPAGEGVDHTQHGPACRCRILRETITRDENTSTLKRYCAGGYAECNVWKRWKDERAQNRERELERQINQTAPKEAGPAVIGA